MPGLLDELLASLEALPADEVAEITAETLKATEGILWFSNPGPQTEALESLADELFYGGEAGGGKTDLLCGTALTQHRNSLILRRVNKQVASLAERAVEMVRGAGKPFDFNGQRNILRVDDRLIEFGGCQFEKDKQGYKGRAKDFYGFDELSDFTESMFRFITTWNRSTVPGQRTRVIGAGNPPTTAEGLWVIRYWAPWLDDRYPRPADEGELRYFTTINGRDVECDGPEPIMVDGELVAPRSRTFIRAQLSDNPDLAATNYAAVLSALPKELRDAYRDGKFRTLLAEQPHQVIPTEWVQAAMDRWDETGRGRYTMSCLSHDVALGGEDADGNAYSRRHGFWFDEVILEHSDTKIDPIELAARDLGLVRDKSAIVIDMGGGYGSGVFSHLKNNAGFEDTGPRRRLWGHNGAEGSTKRSRDGKFSFANKRAEVYWLFREMLEPVLGAPIALPPDPELLADLTAPTWKLTPRGIVIEDKKALVKRLGRSPDKGDAVVNAANYGEKPADAVLRTAIARQQMSSGAAGGSRVNLGHAAMKSRRRR